MIFVDFSDANQSQDAQSLYDVLVPPTEQWYTEASYGRVTLDFDRVTTWFRMPKASAQYGLTAGITGALHRGYIADAIAAADPVVDFRGYDAIYIVPAAGAAIDATLAYTDVAGQGVPADGTEIRHAVTLDPHVTWPGVMVHETGHLFGLPDLYQFGVPYRPDGIAGVGSWDPMSGHSPSVAAQFLGWHKLKFGWLDPSQVRCLSAPGNSLEETLSPLESTGGVKLVVVPTGATTATVVEVRDPIGADTTLCDAGVLVYAVDGAVRTGQTPLRVRRAGSGSDSLLRTRCGTPYDAPFDLGPGEVPVYEDSVVKVEVLATDGASYRVRVAKK
jgi:M6 family metalloprotease-like protein